MAQYHLIFPPMSVGYETVYYFHYSCQIF